MKTPSFGNMVPSGDQFVSAPQAAVPAQENTPPQTTAGAATGKPPNEIKITATRRVGLGVNGKPTYVSFTSRIDLKKGFLKGAKLRIQNNKEGSESARTGSLPASKGQSRNESLQRPAMGGSFEGDAQPLGNFKMLQLKIMPEAKRDGQAAAPTSLPALGSGKNEAVNPFAVGEVMSGNASPREI